MKKAKEKSQKIKKTEEKIADLENKWKRALADYDNLRKRVEKEKEEFVKFANRNLLLKFLEIFDDLLVCERHLKDEGLSLICLRIKKFLEEHGVTEIEALDKDFDPNLMEAVEVVKGPEGKVMELVQRGYLLHGDLLRPVRVKVGGGKDFKKKQEKSEKIKDERLKGNYV